MSEVVFYMACLECAADCAIVPTAYGERANCVPCGIRWTRLRNKGELHIVNDSGRVDGRSVTWLEPWRKERL